MGDNQTNILNITNGSSAVVSHDSESDNTGRAGHSNAEDINVSQDADNTKTSLQTDSEAITDTIRNKTTNLASAGSRGNR